jgi:flavin reductase (DIM6/NTAB) family NADH-FMN oxidoreductase RutF
MYCSYKPAMMAFAIHKNAYSHALLQNSTECVLAVPGENLAEQSLFCGVETGRGRDKFRECGFKPAASACVGVPGIEQAIANVEIKIVQKVKTGDHMLAIGHVLRFGVDEKRQERCLLSVGPREDGYKVLVKRGIHRIGVVNG